MQCFAGSFLKMESNGYPLYYFSVLTMGLLVL